MTTGLWTMMRRWLRSQTVNLLFVPGYFVSWAGVAAHLASLPAWCWAPAYAIGLAACAVSLVPGLIEQVELFMWAESLFDE